MLSNEPNSVPIRPFPPKLPILALDSLPLYAYTDALLKELGTGHLVASFPTHQRFKISARKWPFPNNRERVHVQLGWAARYVGDDHPHPSPRTFTGEMLFGPIPGQPRWK
jgi:hypothetical protein